MSVFTPTPLPTAVANVAALATNASRTANGGVVSTTGYYTAGDGGAIDVVYKRSGRSLITVDGVLFFAGPGADDYWERVKKEVIDIKQAGCVGDGVTDDTDAFVNAVEVAVAAGSLIHIPKGEFLLSSLATPIQIDGDITITGTGYASKVTGPGIDVSLMQILHTSGASISVSSVFWSTFRNVVHFIGRGSSGDSQELVELVLTDNICDNFGQGITNPTGGARIKATSVQIRNNTLTNMGLTLEASDSNHAYAIEVAAWECPKTIISNNLIDTVGQIDLRYHAHGILVDFTGSADDAQSVVISDNIVKNVVSSARASTYQVCGIMALECHPTITGNVIDNISSMPPQSISANPATDVITSNKHWLALNDAVIFKGDDLPNPIVQYTPYYARDITTNTFKISATVDGAAIDITDAGTGTMEFFSPHPSSPEAIYTKSSHSVVSGNTIIDVLGTEGVINMKGEFTGPASAEGSVVSGNAISFRTQPVWVSNSTGVNMAAPNIVCTNNVIEGVNRGCVAIFDGCIISNNTFRNVRATAVEFISIGADYDLIVKDNIFVGIGGASTSAIGVTATNITGYSMGLLEITNNTFIDFTANSNVGILITNVATGGETISKLVVNNNRFANLSYALLLNADAAQEVSYVEFSFNSVYSTDVIYQSVASHRRVRKLMNTLDGLIWDGNDSPAKFDPTSIAGCESWWKCTGSSMLAGYSPDVVANADGQAIARIKDRSGADNHLTVFGGGTQPVLWYGSQHSLPANSVRVNASDFSTTLPAGCKASSTNTLIMVFKVDADTKYLWFYQNTNPTWGSASDNFTFIAENGNVTDPGKGLNVGSPTFRVNGAVADFTFRDNVHDATSSGIVIVTVRNLDLTTWDAAAGKLYLAGYPAGLFYVNPGNLFEAILYSSALTDAQVNQIESYLADEYEVSL